jgi:hypothetical protein
VNGAATPAVIVRSGDDGTVIFEVRDPVGKTLATSAPFATICRLEAALTTLAGAAAQGWSAIHQPAGAIICVGRRKVQLDAGLSDAEIAAAIDAAAAARIVDERAPNRRRHDLSGLRCDLSH